MTTPKHSPGEYKMSASNAELLAAGWTILELDGSCIRTGSAFFMEVKKRLPLDPPLVGNDNWDALSDSLWEGLRTTPSRRIAIVWNDAAVLQQAEPGTFDMAVVVLEDVTSMLADPVLTVGSPKEARLILA